MPNSLKDDAIAILTELNSHLFKLKQNQTVMDQNVQSIRNNIDLEFHQLVSALQYRQQQLLQQLNCAEMEQMHQLEHNSRTLHQSLASLQTTVKLVDESTCSLQSWNALQSSLSQAKKALLQRETPMPLKFACDSKKLLYMVNCHGQLSAVPPVLEDASHHQHLHSLFKTPSRPSPPPHKDAYLQQWLSNYPAPRPSLGQKSSATSVGAYFDEVKDSEMTQWLAQPKQKRERITDSTEEEEPPECMPEKKAAKRQCHLHHPEMCLKESVAEMGRLSLKHPSSCWLKSLDNKGETESVAMASLKMDTDSCYAATEKEDYRKWLRQPLNG